MQYYDGVFWNPSMNYVPDVFSDYIRDIQRFKVNGQDEIKFWPFCETLWKLELIKWNQYTTGFKW